jgi:hypothetical protein
LHPDFDPAAPDHRVAFSEVAQAVDVAAGREAEAPANAFSEDLLPNRLPKRGRRSNKAVWSREKPAKPQLAPPPAPSAGPAPSQVIVRTRSCARSQDELLFGVRDALQAHDPNRLAEYYHWSGMGNSEGYRLMKRLGSLSERPLLDVQLVSSSDPYSSMTTTSAPEPPGGYDPYAGDRYGREGYASDGYPSDPEAATPRPAARPARTPSADLLRVDQRRGEQDNESLDTYFRLRSNAGCWWLQF